VILGLGHDSTVNARKSNRRSLTMLAALVAISMLGNVVGLVIHYGFARHSVAGGVPIADEMNTASNQIR
jgi:hypothetical protein